MPAVKEREAVAVMPTGGQSDLPVFYDPDKVLAMGQKMASALKKVLQQNKWTVKIGPSEHLRFEAWQTLGSFFGYVPTVLEIEPIIYKEKIIGYRCRAGVKRLKDGVIVAEAEATCSRDEPNWRNKPDFQLRSMAQTRACAKALRLCFSWIVTLAGYDPTPAEELDNVANGTANGSPAKKKEDPRTAIAKEVKALQKELGYTDSQLLTICHSAGLVWMESVKDLKEASQEELEAVKAKLEEKLGGTK